MVVAPQWHRKPGWAEAGANDKTSVEAAAADTVRPIPNAYRHAECMPDL